MERIEVNLLPAEYRIQHRSIEIKREFFYPVMLILVVTVFLAFLSRGVRNSLRIYENEIAAVRRSIDTNKPVRNEIMQLHADKKMIAEKVKALEMINVNREKWVVLMEHFSRSLPAHTWLISIKDEVPDSSVIALEGRSYLFGEVAFFMSNLKESPYLRSVSLLHIERIDSEKKLYLFRIVCVLNADGFLPDDNRQTTLVINNGVTP